MADFLHPEHTDFVLNRIDMWNQIKELRPVLEKIVAEGIDNEQEERIARGVCSFILAELEYEQAPESDISKNASNN